MQFALGDSGRFVNEQWHNARQAARTETMNLSEWGDIDIQKYDLDTVDFTGKENPETYKMDHPVDDDEIDYSREDVRKFPSLKYDQ